MNPMELDPRIKLHRDDTPDMEEIEFYVEPDTARYDWYVAEIQTDAFAITPSRVRHFVEVELEEYPEEYRPLMEELSTEDFPVIVVLDSGVPIPEVDVVDGKHRVAASKALGVPVVHAYLGVPKRPSFRDKYGRLQDVESRELKRKLLR